MIRSSIFLICLYGLVANRVMASNIYSDRAVSLLVEHERDLAPSLPYIQNLSNRYQVHVIEALLTHSTQMGQNYQIANKFPELLSIDNVHAARAIKAMVADGRDIMPSLNRLVRIDSPLQVQALKLLVNGLTYEQDSYEIASKMPMILDIKNEFSLEALRLLVSGGVGIRPSTTLIPRVGTQEQLDRIRTFASYRTLNKSIAYVFKTLDERQLAYLEFLLAEEINASAFEDVVQIIGSLQSDLPLELIQKVVRHHYDPSSNAQKILLVTNSAQIKLAEFIMARHLPLSVVWDRILSVTNEHQVTAIKNELDRRPVILGLAQLLKGFGLIHPVFRANAFSATVDCVRALKEP